MRSAFDFAPFRRSTVGFDRLFDMLENSNTGQAQENYPPFDLIKLGDNDYRIELAVAGFKPGEIDIKTGPVTGLRPHVRSSALLLKWRTRHA